MDAPSLTLLMKLDDEDVLAIHKAGQLKSLCFSLSLEIEAATSNISIDQLYGWLKRLHHLISLKGLMREHPYFIS